MRVLKLVYLCVAVYSQQFPLFMCGHHQLYVLFQLNAKCQCFPEATITYTIEMDTYADRKTIARINDRQYHEHIKTGHTPCDVQNMRHRLH